MHKVVAIVFETKAQEWRDGQFSVPEEVTDLLGLKGSDEIALVVRRLDPSREVLYIGVKPLMSGKEIYGAADIGKCLKRGERILVEASLPPTANP
jgi:hypothetical protein